jgi:O-antigen/teichoic acid export membrane protein
MMLVPIFIGFMTSPDQVSFYNIAISLCSFVYLGALAAESAGLSVWSEYVSKSDITKLINEYRLITRWGVIMGSVLFMILLFCPKQLVDILFDKQFLPAAEFLPVIGGVFFINLLTGPTESILKATSETGFIFKARLSAGVITALGIYPALMWWGIYGAILVYAISAMLGGVFMYSYRLWRKYNIHPFDLLYIRVIASLICALIFAKFFIDNYLIEYSSILVLFGSGSVYISCLLIFLMLFGATSEDEMLFFKNVIYKIKIGNK